MREATIILAKLNIWFRMLLLVVSKDRQTQRLVKAFGLHQSLAQNHRVLPKVMMVSLGSLWETKMLHLLSSKRRDQKPELSEVLVFQLRTPVADDSHQRNSLN